MCIFETGALLVRCSMAPIDREPAALAVVPANGAANAPARANRSSRIDPNRM
jgi:hypothetical protein